MGSRPWAALEMPAAIQALLLFKCIAVRLQTNVLNLLRVFDKMGNPKCFTHCGFTYDIEKLRS
jgi:hypothetical protein